MKQFRLTCDEATAICDKNQYKEASLLEKMKLSFHFISCRICKRYTKQNNVMSLIFNRNKESLCVQKKNFLSEEDKELFKRRLEEQIN